VTASAGRRSGIELRRLPLGYLLVATSLPLILLALLGLFLVARQPEPSGALVGEPAPDFTLADLDGQPLRLEDLRGRPVIVNFWAHWCGPCVEEFPLLRDAAAAHAGDGLAIVGIVYRDRSEDARGFMARNGATWPAAMDPGERVADAYGILSVPETFFIGRDGTVVARQIGQLSAASLDEKVAAIIDEE
jgi:cytochrome c biogenesis protein CcmG/thiol:disulfide interchange protein DsbE